MSRKYKFHNPEGDVDLYLTQAQVAKIIGVTEDLVTYWENSRYCPTKRIQPRIINFLDYDPFILPIKSSDY